MHTKTSILLAKLEVGALSALIKERVFAVFRRLIVADQGLLHDDLEKT